MADQKFVFSGQDTSYSQEVCKILREENLRSPMQEYKEMEKKKIIDGYHKCNEVAERKAYS